MADYKTIDDMLQSSDCPTTSIKRDTIQKTAKDLLQRFEKPEDQKALQDAAHQGDPRAQFILALILLILEKDNEQSLVLLANAAMQGYPPALQYLEVLAPQEAKSITINPGNWYNNAALTLSPSGNGNTSSSIKNSTDTGPYKWMPADTTTVDYSTLTQPKPAPTLTSNHQSPTPSAPPMDNNETEIAAPTAVQPEETQPRPASQYTWLNPDSSPSTPLPESKPYPDLTPAIGKSIEENAKSFAPTPSPFSKGR